MEAILPSATDLTAVWRVSSLEADNDVNVSETGTTKTFCCCKGGAL